MMINVDLLKKVAKHIEEEPKRLDMDRWFVEYINLDKLPPFVPSCGTVGCLAGWAAHLGNQPIRAYEGGRLALELDHSQARRLFYLDKWPEEFELAYYNARSHDKRVKITVKRIEHFIETEGRG